MNDQDGTMSNYLDHSLMQLADILRKIGVEEFSMDEHYQQHTINTETDHKLVPEFIEQVAALYARIVIRQQQ